MYWYGGSIAQAVSLSKQKNAIFVVFVEGDNELSTALASTIEDSAVLSRLSNETQFLAVKLKSGSPDYTSFAQIYQFVPVPSLFFIGRNGTPLEVVCAGVEPSNLATRIDRILEEHNKDKPIQPSTSGQNIREQTVNFIQSEGTAPKQEPKTTLDGDKDTNPPPAKVVKPNPADEYVCEGDVCVRRSDKEDQPGPSQKPPAPQNPPQENVVAGDSVTSIEEKLDRAKELIEARRREKAEKEKEQEKEKERERRTTGKGVAELKRWQAEQELKQIQEERRREKQENNLARQRVLEQIARDRAERRARDTPVTTAPTSVQTNNPSPSDSSRARVQFKLPDGTSHTTHFDADGTLADIQAYVTSNLKLPTSSFSLWTAFPRRELTESSEPLRTLGLAPSAALLVLPRRNVDSVTPAPSYTSLFTFLSHLFTTLVFVPSQQVLNWFRARLFPPAAAPRAPSPPAARGPDPAPHGVRRRGNIHRLPTDSGNDDDNNTWNGNSTQQM